MSNKLTLVNKRPEMRFRVMRRSVRKLILQRLLSRTKFVNKIVSRSIKGSATEKSVSSIDLLQNDQFMVSSDEEEDVAHISDDSFDGEMAELKIYV